MTYGFSKKAFLFIHLWWFSIVYPLMNMSLNWFPFKSSHFQDVYYFELIGSSKLQDIKEKVTNKTTGSQFIIIWGHCDLIQYVHQSQCGDSVIQSRVASHYISVGTVCSNPGCTPIRLAWEQCAPIQTVQQLHQHGLLIFFWFFSPEALCNQMKHPWSVLHTELCIIIYITLTELIVV